MSCMVHALALIAVLGLANGGVAAKHIPDVLRRVDCGGFPLRYGTLIGSSGPSIGRQRASSIMAIAAIAPGRDVHARAWVVWDERGNPWLGITDKTPADLRQLGAFKVAPTFVGGVGTQVRFAPMSTRLPAKYGLVDCPDALLFGG